MERSVGTDGDARGNGRPGDHVCGTGVEFLRGRRVLERLGRVGKVGGLDIEEEGGRGRGKNILYRNPLISHLYFPALDRRADWDLLAQRLRSVLRQHLLLILLSTWWWNWCYVELRSWRKFGYKTEFWWSRKLY